VGVVGAAHEDAGAGVRKYVFVQQTMDTITHIVHVDSRDRDFTRFPDPNSYRVRLPRKYEHVLSARLLGAELPSSYFVFSAALGNTQLTVVHNAVVYIATIPDGNYNRTTMPPALALAMHDATTHTYTVTLDDVTGQLTIDSNQPFSIDTRTTATGVGSAPAEWGLAYFLGFPKGAVTAYATSVTAPGCASLNPYTYLLLDIDELSNVETGGLFGTEMGAKTFAKIPMDSASFDYVFSGRDPHQTLLGTVQYRPPIQKLDRLSVRFRFHNDTPVDFRDVEHSFSIELTCRVPHAPAIAVMDTPRPQVPHKRRRVVVVAPQPAVHKSPDRRKKVAVVAVVAVVVAGIWFTTRRRVLTAA
jgi:hypothetical protein